MRKRRRRRKERHPHYYVKQYTVKNEEAAYTVNTIVDCLREILTATAVLEGITERRPKRIKKYFGKTRHKIWALGRMADSIATTLKEAHEDILKAGKRRRRRV